MTVNFRLVLISFKCELFEYFVISQELGNGSTQFPQKSDRAGKCCLIVFAQDFLLSFLLFQLFDDLVDWTECIFVAVIAVKEHFLLPDHGENLFEIVVSLVKFHASEQEFDNGAQVDIFIVVSFNY